MSSGPGTIIVSTSASDTERLAAELAKILLPGDVLALQGQLGAGKTCFIRGLARGLGLDPHAVSSPTFVLVHEYVNPSRVPDTILRLIHVDAYRMTGLADLETIGWDELLTLDDAVIAVEWSERIASALPEDRLDITINHRTDNEQRRDVTLVPRGRLVERLGHLSSLCECKMAETNPATPHPAGPTEPPSADGRPTTATADCPVCGKATDRQSASYPFCSERCRLVDLGRWLGGKYRIGRSTNDPRDEDDE